MSHPKLFLVPFEWLPDYGTEVRSLKAKTQRGASREVQKMLNKKTGPPVPEGYTVLTPAQMHEVLVGLQNGLELWASVHWTFEDVMAARKCSRSEAIAWMEENHKHLTAGITQYGHELIQTLS